MDELVPELNRLDFDLEGVGAYSELLPNGHPLSPDIHSEQVGMWASHLARIPVIRDFYGAISRPSGGSHPGGRGSGYGQRGFPRRAVQVFLDASTEVRAKRRFEQLKSMGMEADLETIWGQIRIRMIRTVIVPWRRCVRPKTR